KTGRPFGHCHRGQNRLSMKSPMEKSFVRLRRCLTRMGQPVLMAGLVLAGFGASAQDKPASISAPTISPQGSAATNNPEADKAWRETFRAIQAPMIPAEWRTNPPTKEQSVAFWVPALTTAADKAKEFYTKYPDYPKAEDARKAEFNLLSMAVQR